MKFINADRKIRTSTTFKNTRIIPNDTLNNLSRALAMMFKPLKFYITEGKSR
jgi:hypothetical protein